MGLKNKLITTLALALATGCSSVKKSDYVNPRLFSQPTSTASAQDNGEQKAQNDKGVKGESIGDFLNDVDVRIYSNRYTTASIQNL